MLPRRSAKCADGSRTSHTANSTSSAANVARTSAARRSQRRRRGGAHVPTRPSSPAVDSDNVEDSVTTALAQIAPRTSIDAVCLPHERNGSPQEIAALFAAAPSLRGGARIARRPSRTARRAPRASGRRDSDRRMHRGPSASPRRPPHDSEPLRQMGGPAGGSEREVRSHEARSMRHRGPAGSVNDLSSVEPPLRSTGPVDDRVVASNCADPGPRDRGPTPSR